MTRQGFHKSWLEPSEPADPIGEALARYRQIERELHEAHMALIRDLSQAFTTPAALGLERD